MLNIKRLFLCILKRNIFLKNKNKYMMKFDFETIITLLIINESFELCWISVIYI